MNSREYREKIRVIVKNSMSKLLPGVKHKTEMANSIASSVYDEFYGINIKDTNNNPKWGR